MKTKKELIENSTTDFKKTIRAKSNLISQRHSKVAFAPETTEMIEFKTPLLVPPTEDAEEVLQECAEPNKKFYQAIIKACPVCGYFETVEITEKQFIKGASTHAKR